MVSNTNERIFVLGATGNVGSPIVKELIAKNIPVTVYVRNTDKAAKLFANLTSDNLLTIVQGDVHDSDALEKALPGHSRMFLMVDDLKQMVPLKTKIATLAYTAGITQVVDLSCASFGNGHRINYICRMHEESENAILNIPNRGYYVSLRPSRFMSNMLRNPPGFEQFDDSITPETPQSWISPNDIAAVAVVVLTGSLEDHDDNVYELTSQVATPAEVAQVLTRVTGRAITYKQVSALERFNTLKAFSPPEKYPFGAIFGLATMIEIKPQVALGISVLLGRDPQTLESYFTANKQALI